MKFRSRLAAIFEMVPTGVTVADIGTDHAYLPVELILQNKVPFAVAGDVHEGPYQAAKATVRQAGLSEKISVRLGDGLAVLCPGEVDTVILAGMGGSTMIAILAASPAVTAQLKMLIMQPMNGAALLRRWLVNQGWSFDAETLVKEEGRLYEIIRVINSANSNRAVKPSEGVLRLGEEKWQDEESLLYEIGPLLWRNKHPLLKSQLTLKIRALEAVLEKLEQSTALSASIKAQQYREQLVQLKEIIACL
jgi:tRNA (adenine22-N1)-methyltransferase